ncbi:MAG TPA: methyltransferase domain-containing protein [Dehalococcoidia bacterium]
MPDFAHFDSRHYRTVSVAAGYGEWAATYEDIVQDEMDIALLDRIERIDWASATAAADLGCGTGRTGAWLRSRGVAHIDGVDLTPEMLARASERGVYRRLTDTDVASTGLEPAAYSLIVCCLVDEHLPSVAPLYVEAARLATPDARFVLVGYHPHFIMASGMPTHFDSASGEPVAIETYVHLFSEHVAAASAAGWSLIEMLEREVDDAWVALKPKWERLRGYPVSFAMVWRRRN